MKSRAAWHQKSTNVLHTYISSSNSIELYSLFMIMIFLAPVTVLFMLLVVTHPDLDDALLVLMTCKPFFSQSESFGNAWLTSRKIVVNHATQFHNRGFLIRISRSKTGSTANFFCDENLFYFETGWYYYYYFNSLSIFWLFAFFLFYQI